MTPELRLVTDYNEWLSAFLASGAVVELDKLEADFKPFNTANTILNEPVSIPWGGTMIGYAGWARFFQDVAPTLGHFAGRYALTEPSYYQTANVVLRESVITINGATTDAPTALAMTEIEKYRIGGGRIVQIDAFFDDTATSVELLAREGVGA